MLIEYETIETEEYKAFVDKFKHKMTTDDCYTPQNIYDIVLDYAVNKYQLQGRPIVRPFYPGGDYENYDYPTDCVVVDNPPFSIFAKILVFYLAHNIDFFLFAPGLTVFGTIGIRGANAIIVDNTIRYENGARVNTCFVTNMGDCKIQTSRALSLKLKNAQRNKKNSELPTYSYPDNVMTVQKLAKVMKYRDLAIKKDELYFIRQLESQKEYKKSIYGSGFLVNDRVAKVLSDEANRNNVDYVWQLSLKEKGIVAELNERQDE